MPNKTGIGSEPIYREIGARIRWLRTQRGWSLPVLAQRMGDIHPSTIAAWETGVTRPGLAELVRLAHAFEVDLMSFLADITLDQCVPSPTIAAARKQKSQKRLATMKARGTSTRNKSKSLRKPRKQKG